MPDLVTVAVFTHPHEMAVHRALLEWEGIACFAKDEHIVSAHPFYSNAVGGIKLQVPHADVERARELLIGSGALAPPDAEGDSAVQQFNGARLPALPMPGPKAVRILAWVLIGCAVVGLVLLM